MKKIPRVMRMYTWGVPLPHEDSEMDVVSIRSFELETITWIDYF